VHVAGLVGDGVVLNSQTPAAAFRNLDEMRHVYGQLDCAVEVRGLDRAALEEASRQRELAYGLDPELERYFEEETA
jgi:murein DD-endopeptidase